MRLLTRLISLTLVAGLTTFALSSCGSGGASNEQGVVFTLFGFFSAAPDDQCEEISPGVSSFSVALSDATETVDGNGGTVRAVIGLQNNMVTQFVRAERAFLSYEVPGGLTPPSTNTTVAAVVPPYVSDDEEEGDTGPESSLPGSFLDTETCNRRYADIELVPAQVRAWLNLNRGSLPEAPFAMVVRVSVSGVTSAGDRIDSNPLDILVQVVPDNIITPSVGSGGDDDDAVEVF